MPSFQQLILALQSYWAERGCALLQPYDMEVGAGTSHTATFLRALGPEPWRAAYVQPSRRPKDGRYGDNPNRLQHYYQYQVVLKPAPADILDLYLGSLAALGLDLQANDVRFVEDDWENPTLGAWGLGWEVWLNGMEVTQFTYFQQVGGIDCRPITGEITYGLERLAMSLQGVDNVFDLVWTEGASAPGRPQADAAPSGGGEPRSGEPGGPRRRAAPKPTQPPRGVASRAAASLGVRCFRRRAAPKPTQPPRGVASRAAASLGVRCSTATSTTRTRSSRAPTTSSTVTSTSCSAPSVRTSARRASCSRRGSRCRPTSRCSRPRTASTCSTRAARSA